MIAPATLTFAYVIDLMIGDPKGLPHPVRIMGWAIIRIERFLRRMIQKTEDRIQNTEFREKTAGVLLVIIIVGFTYGLFYLINTLSTIHHSLFTAVLLIYLTSTTLATRELIESARLVIKALNADDIKVAREKLRCIVGRDTGALDRDGVLKATIESLAENASDGIIAPLFYLSIGGLPLAMAYKAINTLDSMVGYKTEKYKNFGWASAKLDDIANYIPARITGILIAISSFIVYHSLFTVHCSLKTMLHDGRNHPSPNSGVPEAAIAGALGIRLGGPMYYGGILVKKPYIGADKSEVRGQKLILNASERALSIVMLTSLLGFGLAVLFHFLRTAI